MPHVLISTQIRLENGPTIVGDGQADPELMQFLGAHKMTQLGNSFPEWRTEDPPRIVLDKLEKRGYRIVSMCGIGQTCVWTCFKPIAIKRSNDE